MNIKSLALALVMLSFLAGAFVAVLDPVTVNWSWLGPILAVGAVGLFLFRRAVHNEASSGQRLSGDLQTLGQSLERVLKNLQELCADKESLPVYEARFEIDRRFREDLNRFAAARETMIHVFGMRGYANVMSAFAAGERYINRVWSASTDGYVDEVRMYLDKAHAQFEEATDLFGRLRAEQSDHPGLAAQQPERS